ncbi:MAG: glycosyltransferase [Verrucomicrobiota bacterium]
MKPNLLVVELWGVGDLVMATPFLRAASERFSVTLLAKPFARDLQKRFWPDVEVVPFVAPWTAFEHKYRVTSWPWSDMTGLWWRNRKRHFEVGLSARWDPRDHLLLALAGARRRIGFARVGSGILLNEAVRRPPAGTHRYEHWRILGDALGLSIPRRDSIPVPGTRRGNVLIHTGAAQHVRVWPLERFRRLADALRSEGYSVQIACDINQRDWWLATGESGVSTPQTVTELLDHIDQAAVFIGNDSGPGHVAAFNGVPTFTLFGPQLPELFAPLHPGSEWVEGKPCVYRPCSDYCRFPTPHCMWGQEFAETWPRVEAFVQKHASRLERVPVAPDSIHPVSRPRPVGPAATPAGRPMTVLHINNSADIYGASRMLLRYVKTVDRRRFHPVVILPEAGLLKDCLEAEGVEVALHPRLSVVTRPIFQSWRMVLFFLNYPVSVFFLWRFVRSRRVDLVHTNTGVMVSPALAAWFGRVPHIWHIRDWFQEFHKIWPMFSWYVKRMSRQIVAVSNAVADQFEPKGTAMVIHDGFSIEEFQVPTAKLREAFRAQYGLLDGFVVGCVGRIKYVRKGQEILVQATALLRQRGRPIKALIVGAPFPGNEEHLTQLQSLIRELGVGDDVVLTGELPDARPAYAAMDVMALTSAQPEPFGGVVMEAMAMGVPVVATNIGGSLDQVEVGVTGLLVPPADPAALADAIEELRADPGRRARMGAAGMARIAERFTLEGMTEAMEQLFEATIRSGNRRPD